MKNVFSQKSLPYDHIENVTVKNIECLGRGKQSKDVNYVEAEEGNFLELTYEVYRVADKNEAINFIEQLKKHDPFVFVSKGTPVKYSKDGKNFREIVID